MEIPPLELSEEHKFQIAAQLMAGMLANPARQDYPQNMATQAWQGVDDLIKARERRYSRPIGFTPAPVEPPTSPEPAASKPPFFS